MSLYPRTMAEHAPPRRLVYIDHHPDLDEYRACPSGCGEAAAYYTADRADAIGTARAAWGAGIVIMERTRRYGGAA